MYNRTYALNFKRFHVALQKSTSKPLSVPSRMARPAVAAPGPWCVPFLGSVSVLWALIRGESLPNVLRDLRKKYGPLFLVQFGPSRQVWVGPEMLQKVYELPECAGRPASFQDPFGDFLFLVRSPQVGHRKRFLFLFKGCQAAPREANGLA